MSHNNIRNPGDLAKRVAIPRATLYRAFGKDWSGRATEAVLDGISSAFKIPKYLLVKELPCKTSSANDATGRKPSNGGGHRSSVTDASKAARSTNIVSRSPLFG